MRELFKNFMEPLSLVSWPFRRYIFTCDFTQAPHWRYTFTSPF